ncbi:hypothetical protein [Brevundimonas sp. TWP2-3-4b1]|uniref:hypothetical protein n=1 Tax=Brevundimonas sp. TWP2-3-4b1 TaxID=2804580 RepID=UPI003CE72F7E
MAAINGPNLLTQQRIASRLTSFLRSAISTSTARMLSVKRKYQRTACTITAAGRR